MSVLSIISYDIYDNIPIVIKNKPDREYYFIDFTLDNVKPKLSTKPTKYFDDVDDLHHDYFIINGIKKYGINIVQNLIIHIILKMKFIILNKIFNLLMYIN